MRFAYRVVAAFLSIALLLPGLPGPVAHAQQPPAPAAPQPDIFTESLKASAQPPEEAPKTPWTGRLDREAYEGMAVVASGFLVVGRTITCVAGGALGLVSLVLTLGTGYRFATAVVEEGCGGKWTVEAEDLLPDRPMSEAAETK